MTEDQIKHMVQRFLTWKLPDNFNPDGGISFKKMFNEHTSHPMKHEPSGTNLLNAAQAEAMVRHLLVGLPDVPHVTDIELPADVAERLLAIGKVEFVQTFCQSDEKHIDDFRDSLRITHEHFGVEDEETTISYVALEGTETVLAMTGISPNSRQHARILVGAWNWLVAIAKATAEGSDNADR